MIEETDVSVQQVDKWSCGFTVVNRIHHLLDPPARPWSPDWADLFRIELVNETRVKAVRVTTILTPKAPLHRPHRN
jgi:hypothetical protein